ncbi:hypothetical protein NQ314_018583 [Rhamnusium bicolor]|uniref:Plectin/eS10 N-terminal domain-containing protein n=1 Tax=Rhamnusium bicolor TaxID=1586634 RepID=A0AAV8WRA0_9CUCU|nr:hypothetical protein NQ314_018583 [Rhamnusium bicolor]
MLMPKKNRVAIYEYLFKEGVMVAKKDYHAPKHPELETIPNLQVIKALQSLKSKGYVKEQFAWRHYYWYLTNPGIEYLRTFLHLPPEIVPSTLSGQLAQKPHVHDLQLSGLKPQSLQKIVLVTEELLEALVQTRRLMLVQALAMLNLGKVLAEEGPHNKFFKVNFI